MNVNARDIIKKPLITEKATSLKEKENKYLFCVSKTSTKGQIKHAIESVFKVKVESIRTSIVPGKKRRMGAHSGYRSDWKKATVKLQEGQKITTVEGT